MRYTKSEVQGMFNRLIKALNKKQDAGNYDGWHLDYNACYGGYVVEEYSTIEGRNHPFGPLRRTAREMYLSLHMACCVAEMKGNK